MIERVIAECAEGFLCATDEGMIEPFSEGALGPEDAPALTAYKDRRLAAARSHDGWGWIEARQDREQFLMMHAVSQGRTIRAEVLA